MKPRKRYVGSTFFVYHNRYDEDKRMHGLCMHCNDDRFLFEASCLRDTFRVTEKMDKNLYLCENDFGRVFPATKRWLDEECFRIDNIIGGSYRFSAAQHSFFVNGKPSIVYENQRLVNTDEMLTVVGCENEFFKCVTTAGIEWMDVDLFQVFFSFEKCMLRADEPLPEPLEVVI